jgi:hypothetical protein
MSKLQYIKLFEAFESVKLTKTLGYIKDKKDRDFFLDRLKRICNSIDFPYSKLSDEFFDYLPFKKALEKSAIVTDEPCIATSKSEFPGYSIEGEKCTDGKIKRMWGSRTRSVVCPVCNGTGVKPKNSEVKLIKFWFNSDGKFVDITAVDGVIRRENRRDELNVNPYDWNTGIYFGWGSSVQIDPNQIRNKIKDAHFAIVMDFGKIKSSDFMSKKEIIGQRSDIKSGSKLDPDQSDKEIKRRNIERYMNELSKRLDISSDISNCNKLIHKTLGYKNSLYTIIPTSISGEFSTIIDYYLKIMSVDDDSKEYYVERMKDKVQELFKWSQKRNVTVSSSLDVLRKKLEESDKKKHIEFLDKFNELSASVYRKLSDYNIESIDDFEVIVQKILSIKNIMKSDRYGLNRFCSYVIDYLNRSDDAERSLRYMIDPYYFNPEQSLESLERINRIIEKI